jgi:hypothetical protein
MIEFYLIDEWFDLEETRIAKSVMFLIDAGFTAPGSWYQSDVSETPAENLPSEPNICVSKYIAEQGVFDWILASPDYGPGAILYDLPNPYGPGRKPDAAEYGQRRAYAARLGISNAQFRAMFGTQTNPNTRKDGADNLIAWAKTLPKKGKQK